MWPQQIINWLQWFKHRGSRHSGHYIAEVKSERGWLVCNDSQVEQTVKQSIEWCSDAYLLFYEVLSDDELPVSDTPEKGPHHVIS